MSCLECHIEDDQNMVECSNSFGWVHLTCAIMTEEIIDDIIHFYCTECREKHNCIIIWKKAIASKHRLKRETSILK